METKKGFERIVQTGQYLPSQKFFVNIAKFDKALYLCSGHY